MKTINMSSNYSLFEILQKGTIDTAEEFWIFSANATYIRSSTTRAITTKIIQVPLDFLDYPDCFCEICVDTEEDRGNTVLIFADSVDIRFYDDNIIQHDSLESLEREMKFEAFGLEIFKGEIYTPERLYNSLWDCYRNFISYDEFLVRIEENTFGLFDEDNMYVPIKVSYKNGDVHILGFGFFN